MNRRQQFSHYLEPRLEKLIAEYNKDVKASSGDQHITLAKVDVDKMNELSIQYNVTAVPTGKNQLDKPYFLICLNFSSGY